MNYDENKAKILDKLMRLGKWEHAHTSIDNLTKGFPKHVRGDVKDIVKELIKSTWIKVKPTSYGIEVLLNIEKKKEIEEFIERNSIK